MLPAGTVQGLGCRPAQVGAPSWRSSMGAPRRSRAAAAATGVGHRIRRARCRRRSGSRMCTALHCTALHSVSVLHCKGRSMCAATGLPVPHAGLGPVQSRPCRAPVHGALHAAGPPQVRGRDTLMPVSPAAAVGGYRVWSVPRTSEAGMVHRRPSHVVGAGGNRLQCASANGMFTWSICTVTVQLSKGQRLCLTAT